MLSLDQWALQRAHDLQNEILDAYENFQFHQIYQKVHHFCIVDMGGFYLDILKDRMYTMPTNSRGRRSAQTAMFHILEALVRWLAPVLSFTAEEIWHHMPGRKTASVFLETWHSFPAMDETIVDRSFWNDVMTVRQAVARELEKLRIAGDIGSGLDAEVDIYCDDSWLERLRRLGNELRFVFITSYVRIHSLSEKKSSAVETEIKGITLRVAPSTFPKCIRCWHHREDVGIDKEHPQLCARCVQNVAGAGETRSYA
jgi:isoleucyl-tRNA synthetase